MSKDNKNEDKLTIPPILAFSRKLEPSDGLFFSGEWEKRNDSDQWEPILVCAQGIRASKSSRGETNPEQSNPQFNEFAALPSGADTLKVEFTLRILGGVGMPFACGDSDGRVRTRIKEIVEDYKERFGFGELSKRYAINLANGRFLWRNRIGADEVEIRIIQIKKGKREDEWKFDALAHGLDDFDNSGRTDGLSELANLIAKSLLGEETLLEVTAFVRRGHRQQVFPSQEMIMRESRGEKGKILYRVNNVAAMHSQKIGNAFRTIDTWYEGAEGNGPISVEPFGSVTMQRKAWRKDGGRDFYNLFDKWIIKNKVPDRIGDQHYVIATLIRGGVFGKKGSDE